MPFEIWSELKHVHTHTHARVQCYTEAVQEGNILVAVFNGICKLDIYNALFYFTFHALSLAVLFVVVVSIVMFLFRSYHLCPSPS